MPIFFFFFKCYSEFIDSHPPLLPYLASGYRCSLAGLSLSLFVLVQPVDATRLFLLRDSDTDLSAVNPVTLPRPQPCPHQSPPRSGPNPASLPLKQSPARGTSLDRFPPLESMENE